MDGISSLIYSGSIWKYLLGKLSYISLKEEVKLFLVDMNASGTDETMIDEHINKILLHESTFLVKMDSIVCTYEKEARDYVKFVEVSHTFLFVIIMLTMVFIIFKIFIPLLNYSTFPPA